MIMKIRFDEAKYLLPRYNGQVFDDWATECALLEQLGVDKEKFAKLLKSMGLSLVAGVGAGSTAAVIQGASMPVLTSVAIALGLTSAPVFVPLAAAGSVATATALITSKGLKKTKKKEVPEHYEMLSESMQIEDYGKIIADLVFPNIIYFMRMTGPFDENQKKCLDQIIKTWGYSAEYRSYWENIATTTTDKALILHRKQAIAIIKTGEPLRFISLSQLVNKSNEWVDKYCCKINHVKTEEEKKYLNSWAKVDSTVKTMMEIEKLYKDKLEAENKLKNEELKLQMELMKKQPSKKEAVQKV